MKIVIAPDSFKECLSAVDVAAALAKGVRRAMGDRSLCLVQVPMADGGQGTVATLVAATGGCLKTNKVTGPLGEPLDAEWGMLGDGRTAVIEMAAASGLERVPRDRRDPSSTTTFGTGELILAALDQGACRLIVGIGGSATNDGGAGVAQALGYRLLDKDGRSIGRGGGALEQLHAIDASARDPRLQKIDIDVACDVTNPLTGPQGASAIYGPQKGADPAMVARLDRNLERLAAVAQRDLGIPIRDLPGAGAAGGLGAGLVAFANGRLRRGVELVIEAVDLDQKLVDADLCLTGEGSLDGQSRFGKTAIGVATVAHRRRVPTIILCGALGDGAQTTLAEGVTASFAIVQRPCSLAEAIQLAPSWLEEAAEQVVRVFLAGRIAPDIIGDRSA